MAQEKGTRLSSYARNFTQVMSPRETHGEGEAVAALILFWVLSYYLRHVTQFMAYGITTLLWGGDDGT
jgi:hypothetical protein